MAEQVITCPTCGTKIELSEALTGTIRDSLRSEIGAEVQKKEQELLERQEYLAKRGKQLSDKERSLQEELEKRLNAGKEKLRTEAYKKAQEETLAKTKSLEAEIEEKTEKLREAQKQELAFRKEQRQLKERQEALELEVERKLDEGRRKIAEEAMEKATEAQRLKMRGKDDLIQSLQKQMEDLQRKIEVGSQERQGEVLEGELQDTLTQAFPFDEFEEIKKGVRGADILQRVRNSIGKDCGTILWESKNTKDFSKGWIDELKKDQQDANADIAVIMSVALPKEIKNFGPYEDIWVTDCQSAIGLCAAFRQTLINVARERMIVKHQDTMKDIIYKYITGREFILRIKAVVNAYKLMQEDLESEKRAINKIWNKREKQISAVLENVTGMYGEIEGLVGGRKALPGIDSLSLEAIALEEEEES